MAGAFPRCIYNGVERIRSRFVKAIEKVEKFADQIEAHAFAKPNSSGYAAVHRKIRMRQTHVAAEVAICRENSGQTARIDARRTQCSIGQNRRPLIRTLKIAVCVADRQNVERPAR